MLLLVVAVAAAPIPFDVAASTLAFRVGSTLGDVNGRAKVFDGEVDPAAGTGVLSVVVRGLSTGLGPRDARITSVALEAERFPTIRFVVHDIAGLGDAVSGAATLSGDLTVRDVTRPLEVPARCAWEGTSLRLTGSVEFAWADFGVPDPSVVVATAAPSVTVSFDLVARPPEPPDPREPPR